MDAWAAARIRRAVLASVSAVALVSLHAFGLAWVTSAAVTAAAVVLGLALAARLLAAFKRLGTTRLSIVRIAAVMNRKGMLAPGERIGYGELAQVVDADLNGAPYLHRLLPGAPRGTTAPLSTRGVIGLCITDRQLIVWGTARQFRFELGRLWDIAVHDDGTVLLQLLTPQALTLTVKPLGADPAQMVRALEPARDERWNVLGTEQIEDLWRTDGSTDVGRSET